MLGRPTPMNTVCVSRRRRAATIVWISPAVASVVVARHRAATFRPRTFSFIHAVNSSRSRLILSQNL